MVAVGLLVTLEAKPGKEDAVASFLQSALTLVEQEPETVAWFGVRLGQTEFAIIDAFPSEAGREAHLTGPVAAALMESAADLLAEPPRIQAFDALADKLPSEP
jgi:quinol monooxygenase YgiN